MSGKPLSLRVQEMVMSWVEFFEKEKAYRKKIHGNDVCRRTAEALGVSERTAYSVKAQMEAGQAAASAGEHSGGPKPTEFDPFMGGLHPKRNPRFLLVQGVPNHGYSFAGMQGEHCGLPKCLAIQNVTAENWRSFASGEKLLEVRPHSRRNG